MAAVRRSVEEHSWTYGPSLWEKLGAETPTVSVADESRRQLASGYRVVRPRRIIGRGAEDMTGMTTLRAAAMVPAVGGKQHRAPAVSDNALAM